jgi:dTDP-glucose 4,6-dehydratase
VSALWAVHEHGKIGGTYNIGGNNESTNLDLVHAICKILAEETGCEQQDLLDLITFVKDRPGHDLRYAIDATKLKNECGWTPAETVESGLRKTVTWYVQNQAWCESVTTGEYLQWIEQNYGKRDAS